MAKWADWHTHTRYSDGRGTVRENLEVARQRGLASIAITDHGPANIGVGVENGQTYLDIKKEIADLAPAFPELEIKVGAEADIISPAGTIDLPEEVIKELDLLIVGLHPYVWPADTDGAGWVIANQLARLSRGYKEKIRTDNTKTVKEALHQYPVDILSHPDLGMPLDRREIALCCAEQGVAYEINTGHHYQKVEDIRELVLTGVEFVVNSDAHFPATVGRLTDGIELLQKAGVPEERIRNCWQE